MSLAWSVFGRKNGVPGRDVFLARIREYRREAVGRDPVIGCLALTEPFFLSEDEWVDAPSDWPRNTVQGKTYDLDEAEGARIWRDVQFRLASRANDGRGGTATVASRVRESSMTLDGRPRDRWTEIRTRLGQGAFRVAVTSAYNRKCAISGEKTLPALDAAHIRPFGSDGPNDVRNGMLLRSDLHRLFDGGYVTVDPDLRVVVSSRIREEFQNGREYYRFDGRPLSNLPNRADMPSPEFLVWHNENVFEQGGVEGTS